MNAVFVHKLPFRALRKLLGIVRYLTPGTMAKGAEKKAAQRKSQSLTTNGIIVAVITVSGPLSCHTKPLPCTDSDSFTGALGVDQVACPRQPTREHNRVLPPWPRILVLWPVSVEYLRSRCRGSWGRHRNGGGVSAAAHLGPFPQAHTHTPLAVCGMTCCM